MYGAEGLPMISPYEWFSITMTKTWSKAGTDAARVVGASPMTAIAAARLATASALIPRRAHKVGGILTLVRGRFEHRRVKGG